MAASPAFLSGCGHAYMRTRLDADFSTRESDVHLVLVRLHFVACKITLFHPGFGGLGWHSARGALQIATANLVWKS